MHGYIRKLKVERYADVEEDLKNRVERLEAKVDMIIDVLNELSLKVNKLEG